MPEYSFKDNLGKSKAFYFPIGKAPKFGATHVDEDGVVWTRVIDIPRFSAGQDSHFVSSSLPRWDPSAPDHDASGKPRFNSKKEVKEYVAKTEGDWTYGEI